MSLRRRFAVAASGIVLVTLGGSLSAVWVAYSASQERQLDSALLLQAEGDAREASYSEDLSGSGGPSLHRAELQPISTYATIYASDGQALAWTPNLQAARPRLEVVRRRLGSPFDLWWNNEHLRAVFVPVQGDGGRSLWLATPRTSLDADARDLAQRMAVAVFVAVAVSAAMAWWTARLLTRDHDRLAAVARAVAAGNLSARVGSCSSDPEVARLGRDVDEMISRLAVLLETQQRFIANASHELRSPVTTILGELSFALHREREAASYRESIEEALNSTRRLKVLTEELLALARVGSTDFEPEPVLLSDVADAALASSRAAAEATGVELGAACGGATVEGHPGDLQRLVRNLVENAIRHSPRGGHVQVEAYPTPEEVRLVVSDEGPGIAREVRERIFEPFFRSPAARADQSGAGLGLAIARSIARAHGGDLWVDDSASHARGARFVVRLPLGGTTSARV
jgi:two-component system, OmpR family, sensor kinase